MDTETSRDKLFFIPCCIVALNSLGDCPLAALIPPAIVPITNAGGISAANGQSAQRIQCNNANKE